MTRARRHAKACLPAVALLAALAAAGPPVRAASGAPEILGHWELLPFTFRGCAGRQSLHIRRGDKPGRYVGDAVTHWRCSGQAWSSVRTDIYVTIDGKRILIRSRNPRWIGEKLQYISPLRMRGKDESGRIRLIYVRPKGPPTS